MKHYFYRSKGDKPTEEEVLTKTFNMNGIIESVREIKRFLAGFLDSDVLKNIIQAITDVIPAEASSSNKLADKHYVNEGISTATADFKGTFTAAADMEAVTANRNDFAYLITQDAIGNTQYDRYKWVVGTGWMYEYTHKQDDFTLEEWAAIRSGITTAHVSKLDDLPNNTDLTAALAGKQDTISDLSTIRSGAEKGATAYQKPGAGIPQTDLAENVSATLNKASIILKQDYDCVTYRPTIHNGTNNNENNANAVCSMSLMEARQGDVFEVIFHKEPAAGNHFSYVFYESNSTEAFHGLSRNGRLLKETASQNNTYTISDPGCVAINVAVFEEDSEGVRTPLRVANIASDAIEGKVYRTITHRLLKLEARVAELES